METARGSDPHFGYVNEAGALKLHTPAAFRTAVRVYAGRAVEVLVRLRRNSRSERQNRWYWGQLLELMSVKTGHTPEELHEYCKARFLPRRMAICDGNGEVLDERVVGGSTGKLSTREMAAYCEEIRRFAIETLDLVIPDPDPDWAKERDERRA